MHWYRVSGLAVRSEISLPGLLPLDEQAHADVTIYAIYVPVLLHDAVASGPNWQRSAHQFLFEIPAVGRFLLDDGHSIGFTRAAGVGEAEIAVFLAGNVFGILLHQRGTIVLHASGVAVGGKAVLFCGVSGAGKSTMAAALGERGHRLLTDDQAAIALRDDGAPVVHPDGRLLRLWATSISALALGARRRAAMRPGIEKFYVEPGAASAAALPVGAVYVLAEAQAADAVEIERLNVVDASQALIGNAYRPWVVQRMGQRELYFKVGAALAAAAGIYAFSRPLRFEHLDETIAALRAHWVETGLCPELVAAERLG